MAGEWIKVEVSTPDKPEVMRMARLLKTDADTVLGKLVRMWAWFDRNSVDGVVDGVVAADVDALVSMQGFSAAAASVKWLLFNDEKQRMGLPNFGFHNGETAKKRALKNKRQANWRSRSRDDDVDATQSTKASTREEKRREDIKPKPLRLNGAFDEFWKAYPRKKSKGQAERAWLKLNPDPALAEKILSAVVGASSSNDWLREGGKFIPYPATWLNAKGWEDGEIVVIPSRPSIVCESCGERSFTWTGHKCDRCWRGEQRLGA